MSQSRILVLPAGMPTAIRYACVNREHQYLIGASSNLYEPARGYYQEYTYLPHISDADFLEAFKRVVEDRKIVGVVCQHQVIWSYLQQHNYPGMPPLLNPAPIPSQLSPYRSAMQDSAEFIEYIRHFDPSAQIPVHLQIAGLLKHFDDIPGACDLVVPCGWIILDDYTWKAGDGPKVAGDRYLRENMGRISHAFIMGGALAIRKVA